MEAGAVTLDDVARLQRTLGVMTCADLRAAAHHHAIRDQPGLGESIETAIANALPSLRSTERRIPISRALATASGVLDVVRTLNRVEWALPVGSLRRGHETVGDVEVLVSTSDFAEALEEVSALATVGRVRRWRTEDACVTCDGLEMTVRGRVPAEAGAMLLYLTGTWPHLIQLESRALARALCLGPDGLWAANRSRLVATTESEIYGALGLPFIPQELRNGDDEIALAEAGHLPTLVSRQDIRGDLHMHTHWSDGRDSIEAMVAACATLDYAYLAITDHSPSSAAAHNLTVDDVARQADAIQAVRERYPRVAVLHCCEVDILPDGGLDFPDAVLQRFDIVLASLHDRAGHSGGRLLERYLAAMRHPLVSVVTHPANRSFSSRAGYDLDFDRLFEVARETGTALEIDGAPTHIDLEAGLARRAAEAGVTLSISGDSHRADALQRHMEIGLLTARRARVERQCVLNARSLPDVRAFLVAKRG